MGDENQDARNERVSKRENERAADIQETVNNCGTCQKPLSDCGGHG